MSRDISTMEEVQIQVDLFVSDNLEKIEQGQYTGLTRDGKIQITSRSTPSGISSYIKSVKTLNKVEQD